MKKKRILKILLALSTVMLVATLSCSNSLLAEKPKTAVVSFSIATDASTAYLAGYSGSERFLTADIEKVLVSAYRGSVSSGNLIGSKNFAVTSTSDGYAKASGSMELPVGVPLVIVAEIKAMRPGYPIPDSGPYHPVPVEKTIASDEKRVTLNAGANNSIKLRLMPGEYEIEPFIENEGSFARSFSLLKSDGYAWTSAIFRFNLTRPATELTLDCGDSNAPVFYNGFVVPAGLNANSLKIQLRDSNGLGKFSAAYEAGARSYTIPGSFAAGTHYLVLSSVAADNYTISGNVKITPTYVSVPGPGGSSPSVLVAATSNKVYYSLDDARTWAPAGTGAGTPDGTIGLTAIKDLMYVNGGTPQTSYFIAVGQNNLNMAAVAFSLDGITWAEVTLPNTPPVQDWVTTSSVVEKIAADPSGKLMLLIWFDGSVSEVPTTVYSTVVLSSMSPTPQIEALISVPTTPNVLGPVWTDAKGWVIGVYDGTIQIDFCVLSENSIWTVAGACASWGETNAPKLVSHGVNLNVVAQRVSDTLLQSASFLIESLNTDSLCEYNVIPATLSGTSGYVPNGFSVVPPDNKLIMLATYTGDSQAAIAVWADMRWEIKYVAPGASYFVPTASCGWKENKALVAGKQFVDTETIYKVGEYIPGSSGIDTFIGNNLAEEINFIACKP